MEQSKRKIAQFPWRDTSLVEASGMTSRFSPLVLLTTMFAMQLVLFLERGLQDLDCQ